MKKFHIRIIAGWCGNQMLIVGDHLEASMKDRGYEFKLDYQSIWENNAPPMHVDLVFQLIPAFSPEELRCPSVPIRPLLKDLNHAETMENVFRALEQFYPAPVHLLD